MTMGVMGLTPLELNLHKYDPVIISLIMEMIEADKFWHQKIFEAVLTDLQRRRNEGIHEQKDVSMYSTEKAKSTMKWMEWKLLTCAVQVRLKLVNETMEQNAQSKKVRTK